MVITVGRQYGSGGREIGTALANKLGIVYYDDLLLKKAAEESGLCEELFHSFDERPKSFLYSIAMDPYSFTMHHVTPKGSIEQQVYLATYDTIKKLADKGPCVLIGRCADYALKDRDDVINIFVSAPIESRIKRVAARNNISEAEAKERIKKTDKSARRTITTIPRRTGAKPRATTCASTRRFSASRGRSRCLKSW